MQDYRRLTLWPTEVVLGVHVNDTLNAALLPLLLKIYAETSLGTEHYQRIPHNIFDRDDAPLLALKDLLLSVASSHFDLGDGYEIDGHEIVSHDRQFIKPHVDSEEGDLTLQYFVQAPPENEGQPLNQFGNSAFVLLNPARPSGSHLFPSEQPGEFPVLPRKGLLVMYRSHIPHYQTPYHGSEAVVQVVCNIKLKRVPH